MYSQQAYPSFTLNHDIIQDGFEDYHHPSQAFFSPAVRTDSGALGEHQAQVMAQNHAPQLEPPGHLNFCAPQSHQLNMETPCMVESRKIEDSDGSIEKSHLIPQDYPHDWIPASWPGSPNFFSQTQQNTSIPGSEMCLTPPNQSPNMQMETVVDNLESNLCSSTPTQAVAKESSSPASRTVTSLGAQENILSEDGEDMLEMPSKMEMEQFARDLRQKRQNMGYTQAGVRHAVRILYGKNFSQTMISNFESVQLSYKHMCQIKPFLHRWLEDAENNESNRKKINRKQALALSWKRKPRITLDKIVKNSLEIYFRRNPKPGSLELKRIARDLHMGKEVVHVWFCNRRQKEKSLLVKNLSNTGYEPQHICPHVPRSKFGSPPMYNPTFHHNNLFQQPEPHGMQLGNQIC